MTQRTGANWTVTRVRSDQAPTPFLQQDPRTTTTKPGFGGCGPILGADVVQVVHQIGQEVACERVDCKHPAVRAPDWARPLVDVDTETARDGRGGREFCGDGRGGRQFCGDDRLLLRPVPLGERRRVLVPVAEQRIALAEHVTYALIEDTADAA